MSTFIIFIAVFPTMLLVQIYLLGLRMSKPENMIKPNPGGLTTDQQAVLEAYNAWLASANLEFRSCFRFGSIQAVVYQQKDQPRFFSFMFHKRITFAAESYWEGLNILDTSNSGSLGLFPRPGAYAQSFPGISAEEVWKRHLEGEEYLTTKFGFPWVRIKMPYLQLVAEATRIRMQYARSQSFWPFRVLYRYFVTRHTIRNKTVMQQYP
jgi:hypothetical protein